MKLLKTTLNVSLVPFLGLYFAHKFIDGIPQFKQKWEGYPSHAITTKTK